MDNPDQLSFDIEQAQISDNFEPALDLNEENSLFIKRKDDITFGDLPDLKILLDKLNSERENYRNKIDASWYASPNSLGYWQRVFISTEFDIVALYSGDNMIGFAVSYLPGEVSKQSWQDISYLYISPTHRGKGYAKLLMNALLHNRSEGFETRVWLRPEASKQISFFKNLGFEFLDETWIEKIFVKRSSKEIPDNIS